MLGGTNHFKYFFLPQTLEILFFKLFYCCSITVVYIFSLNTIFFFNTEVQTNSLEKYYYAHFTDE